MRSAFVAAVPLLATLLGCSAIVSSELDGKPGSSAGGTTQDASFDALSEDAADDQSSEADQSVEDVATEVAIESGPEADVAQDDGDAEPACPGCDPELCCGDKCCPGTVCSAGQCTSACQLPYLDCDGNIITNGCEANASTDPSNCGGCGIECPYNTECVGGLCKCAAGTADCDGQKDNGCEVDTTSAAGNCGGCGKTCASNQLCAQSLCECASGFGDCDGNAENGCEVDTRLTAAHCGGCAKPCGANEECLAGSCDCTVGFLDCDAQAGCETPATDPAHCGTCQTVCKDLLPVCNAGTCTDTCPSGLTLCNGNTCVNVAMDPMHCGGCNQQAVAHQHCAAGKLECDTGWGDCNGQAGDGCEASLNTDFNCGACGGTCKSGAVCSTGTCACSATRPFDCGSTCEACCGPADCNDGDPCTQDLCGANGCSHEGCATGTMCCGGQGCYACCTSKECGPGQTCSGNQCIEGCDPGLTACNGNCIDTTFDPLNCGGCGRACLTGRQCASGDCSPEWIALPSTTLSGREWACSVWAGSKMFVWGGQGSGATLLGDGATWTPSTNAWSMVNGIGAPAARAKPTCVWTGSVVVVWGGGTPGTTALTSGGGYDPNADGWMPMAAASAGRFAPVALWTGSRVIVWGGADKAGTGLKTGQLYDPTTDTWTAMSAGGAPPGTIGSAAVWVNDKLYYFGGRTGTTYSDDLHIYTAATNVWAKWDDVPEFGARTDAFMVHIGGKLLMWGGRDATGVKDTGVVYDIAKKTAQTITAGTLGARAAVAFESGWSARSGNVAILLGGLGTSSVVQSGIAFDMTTMKPTTASVWTPAGEHLRGVAAFSGEEFVVWSGVDGQSMMQDGSRWLP